MSQEPFSFQFRIADFDLKRLPIDPEVLRENPEMLIAAVQGFYQDYFAKLGGQASVLVSNGAVSVSWFPKSGNAAEQLFEHATKLLRTGDYRSAEPLLRSLLARNPDSTDVLLNLGMMLSDEKKLDEAIELLERLVELDPEHSSGWTALGVAQSRKGDHQSAIASLERAVEIAPDDIFALRNLGSLSARTSPERALPILEKVARSLPKDQIAQHNYALCLLNLGRTEEASEGFSKTIDIDPHSEVAEKARDHRRAIAEKAMRSGASGGTRPDAVMYCLDALQKFNAMGMEKTRAIVFEIAVLGRGGLDINNPDTRYTLRVLPGDFSGLQLVSLLYTGMQLIQPGADVGIDLSGEFAAAKELLAEKNRKAGN